MTKHVFPGSALSAVIPALVLAGAVGAGCASTQHYGFRPTAMVASSEGGFPASRYVVTPTQPQGEVYLTSFGTREVESGEAGTQLVHVRMAVHNQHGALPWAVDPGQQMMVPYGGSPQRPDFMEVDGKASTGVTVEHGQRRVFDLYYRLPGGVPDAGHLPGFDLQWQVNTGAQLYAERTPFAREPTHHRHSHTYVAFGPPWWAHWYGSPWGYWAYGPWPYYGYGPHVGVGIGVRYPGYHRYGGGPRYGGAPAWRGGGGGFRGGGFSPRMAPAIRGRPGR